MSDFFNSLHQSSEIFGVWDEMDKGTLFRFLESAYNKKIIQENEITDVVINNNKVLVKWNKRYRPLTDEEVKKKYGI